MIYKEGYRIVTTSLNFAWPISVQVALLLGFATGSLADVRGLPPIEGTPQSPATAVATPAAANSEGERVEPGKTVAPADSAPVRMPSLSSWPPPLLRSDSAPPLTFLEGAGPYSNEAGRRWVEQIDAWFDAGEAAGLSQDTFRSFDDGHSGVRLSNYPQLNSVKPVPGFGHNGTFIFPERVTFGVQSYGAEGLSVIEAHTNAIIRGFYESKLSDVGFQKFYQTFYDYNFLFVAPAVGSYSDTQDTFSFLSPYYLHSVGRSGSDARLLKPLIFASAALPPDLKTRALRTGRYVPTLMYLFKNAWLGDLRSPQAHCPAYALPEEANDDWTGPAPFLDRLVQSAHELSHLPPVCAVAVDSIIVEASEDYDYADRAYSEISKYGVTGALRKGQTFRLTVDLSGSWTDGGRSIAQYHVSVLRGQATITPLNADGSALELRIPWTLPGKTNGRRTDLLLLVHDGTYHSAPAYISIRHINELDPLVRNIPAQ